MVSNLEMSLFLYLTISLKIPIIIISHIIHGNTPESSPLPLQNRHTPHNKQQNEMQALYLMIASKNSWSEFCNYGLPLHITADVQDWKRGMYYFFFFLLKYCPTVSIFLKQGWFWGVLVELKLRYQEMLQSRLGLDNSLSRWFQEVNIGQGEWQIGKQRAFDFTWLHTLNSSPEVAGKWS